MYSSSHVDLLRCVDVTLLGECGFPLSEARGKDGPFIPCYASLPLEVPKAGGNKEDKTSLYGVVRGVHPCVALRRAYTRLICF